MYLCVFCFFIKRLPFFIFQFDRPRFFRRIIEIAIAFKFRRDQYVIKAILGAAIHLCGQTQTGAHRFSSAGNRKKHGGIRIFSEIKCQFKAHFQETFVIELINDIGAFDTVFILDYVNISLTEVNCSRFDVVVLKILIIVAGFPAKKLGI